MALVLLVIGTSLMSMMLVTQASDEDGQFGIDFNAYYLAAERYSSGDPIYTAELLSGPIHAQGVDRYKYPPPFAQVLRPLAVLAPGEAALVWLIIQALAVLAALWLGTGIGGARASPERALWCGVAAVFFLPVFDTLWKGNISGILALSSVMVALGGAAAGIGAAAGALLKSVPGTLVFPALAMDSRARVTVLVTLGIGAAVSFVLAPAAWLDYPTVVRNLLSGTADFASNLAPATVAAGLGLPDLAIDLIRIAMLALVIASVIGSVLLARTRGGLPAAALLAVIAMLLLPSSLWYHYLVILLPFAAIAWPRATGLQRGLLFGSAAIIVVSLVWLPLALLGGVMMATVSLLVIRPRSATAAAPDPELAL